MKRQNDPGTNPLLTGRTPAISLNGWNRSPPLRRYPFEECLQSVRHWQLLLFSGHANCSYSCWVLAGPSACSHRCTWLRHPALLQTPPCTVHTIRTSQPHGRSLHCLHWPGVAGFNGQYIVFPTRHRKSQLVAEVATERDSHSYSIRQDHSLADYDQLGIV